MFKHALTQEVAYNSVLLERRKQLHETVGRAIELIYGASIDDHVTDLAHHFSRSGNSNESSGVSAACGRAGAGARRLAQAVQDFETALTLLEDFPTVRSAIGANYRS